MPAEPASARIAARARAAAASHRLGMSAQGGAELAALVDELVAHLAERPALAVALSPLLARVLAAQEHGDPIGLADALEHELAPALASSA
jgi:hypothetical protein